MSHYWRNSAVPHIEIRNVEDGRTFSHESHAHATFSIGAIMAGQSSYLNGRSVCHISAGSVVLMNPGVGHACNPLQGQPWAYRMFYVACYASRESTGFEWWHRELCACVANLFNHARNFTEVLNDVMSTFGLQTMLGNLRGKCDDGKACSNCSLDTRHGILHSNAFSGSEPQVSNSVEVSVGCWLWPGLAGGRRVEG